MAPGPAEFTVGEVPAQVWPILLMILPARRQLVARLAAWEPASPPARSPAVDGWAEDPDPARLRALLAGPFDREEGAAFVLSAPADARDAVCFGVVSALPAAERVSVVRAALSQLTDPEEQLVLLARVAPALGSPDEARVASVVAVAADAAVAERLVRGEWPTLRAVLAAPGEGGRLWALQTAGRPVEPDEAAALLRRFEDAGPALPWVLAAVPAERRIDAFLAGYAAVRGDSARLALLRSRADLVREVDARGEVGALLRGLSFDSDRAEAVDALLAGGADPAGVWPRASRR